MRSLIPPLPFAATLVLLLGTAVAQDPDATTTQSGPPILPVPVVDVDFRGGSFPALVQMLRTQHPDLNIVMSEHTDQVKLPPLQLQQVEVEDALQVAASVAIGEFQVSIKSQRSRWGQPVYTILVREVRNNRTTQTGSAPTGEREVSVFSLRPLTSAPAGVSAEDAGILKSDVVLSAVETGLRLVPGEAATVRYHADSGLLFVQGTNQQISVVNQILQRVESDQNRMRSRSPKLGANTTQTDGR